MSKIKSLSLTDLVTMSPIELSWTAKKREARFGWNCVHDVEGKTHNVVFLQLVLERKYDFAADYQNKSNFGYKSLTSAWYGYYKVREGEVILVGDWQQEIKHFMLYHLKKRGYMYP